MLDAGVVLNERYEIKEQIGAGGMSIVYRARCKKLHRDVAIKVLRNEFVEDEEFLASFKAEALAAASLSHPNIVGIYDVGNDLGRHYIVMEYIKGKTLKQLIEAEAPYSTRQVLDYGIDILSAIRHAHMKKIIHRDIKPQNILVTSDHIVKVTDFGIARAVDSSTLVSTGNAIGSVHYFSPEQARGKYVDETSDLYSCGIVLFELATGRLPFQADSHVSVALKHIKEEIPKPTTFNNLISDTLEKIILKATEKRKELRYPSAQTMLQDLLRLRSNPGYTIVAPVADADQKTILMTEEETELIRQQSDDELDIPNWSAAAPMPEDPLANRKNRPPNGDDEDEEEVSSTYTLMVTIAGVLAAVVLIGIIAAFLLPMFSKPKPPKAVAVPDIITMQLDEATEMLKDIGLEIKLISEEEMEGIPAGQIIDQAPKKEKIVPGGTVVEVIVSKEIEIEELEEIPVPRIIEMDFVEAQSMLGDVGLVMQITEREFDDYLEVDMIISQNPMSGNILEEGDVVSVIVSKGKEIKTIKVPTLTGIAESTAVSNLKAAGLSVGNVTYKESETVEKGIVMEQGVPAGRNVDRASSVSLVVSLGKVEVKPEEPEEPEEQVAPKPTEKTKNLTISIPQFIEEKDSYMVLVRLLNDNGESSTIYQGQVNKDQFPITVPVKGKGKGTVETYIDNEPTYADPINFGE